MISAHQLVAVTESSQPSAARFLACDVATAAGFDAVDVHRAGLVATELGTNLVKHATGGALAVRLVSAPPDGCIELIAIDRGPGMPDVGRCLVDGHSTSGTAGTGLGAIRRLSDTFDVFSDERGTVVLSQLRAGRTTGPAIGFAVGAISFAKPGEPICGDAWTYRRQSDATTIVVADGLGHGFDAAKAAEAALHAFRSARDDDNVRALQRMHDGIRHTRGAAAAIAKIEPRPGVVRCAGVGNIATAVCLNGTVRQAVSHNGTLGLQARVIREYSYPWSPGALVVMHSDGLSSHWTLDRYRGLRRRHAAVIAAVLCRDYSRDRDDVTVVVAKENE